MRQHAGAARGRAEALVREVGVDVEPVVVRDQIGRVAGGGEGFGRPGPDGQREVRAALQAQTAAQHGPADVGARAVLLRHQVWRRQRVDAGAEAADARGEPAVRVRLPRPAAEPLHAVERARNREAHAEAREREAPFAVGNDPERERQRRRARSRRRSRPGPGPTPRRRRACGRAACRARASPRQCGDASGPGRARATARRAAPARGSPRRCRSARARRRAAARRSRGRRAARARRCPRRTPRRRA